MTPAEWDPYDPGGADPSRWDESRVVVVRPGADPLDPIFDAAAVRRMVGVVAATARHRYVLLTSRAKRLLVLGNEGLPLPPNLWVGVTVSADEDVWRAEDLLRCNTPNPWVAVDPMTGPVPSLPVEMLRWVVCGLGPDPVAEQWAADLRERCRNASVPFRLQVRGPDGTAVPRPVEGREWWEAPPDLTGV